MCVLGRFQGDIWWTGWKVIGVEEGRPLGGCHPRSRWEVTVARPRPVAAGWKEVARLTEIQEAEVTGLGDRWAEG